MARGYLDDPSLTAAKFSVDEAGVRWFRTGDVARRMPRGLVLCGRLDHQVIRLADESSEGLSLLLTPSLELTLTLPRQVKLRGVRVEPGEVEAALSTSSLVRRAVVVKADAPERLVAWVVLSCGDREGEEEEAAAEAAAAAMMAAGGEACLRLHCKRLLAPHQVPAQLLLLPGM